MRNISIFGFILGIAAILGGNLLEGGSVGALFQLTAGVIVFGGTFGATMASHRMEDLKLAFSYSRGIFRSSETMERRRIANEINESAKIARRESILALEKKLNTYSDPFMRSVFRFVIDGVDPETIRKVFHAEIDIQSKRKSMASKVWMDAGGFAPTIGIIGAVLGLIQVMANISDTAALGHGIAVAFVATVYGVGSANLIFIPIANKLKSVIDFRSETEEMILEGGLAILSGLNPYIIEQRVQSYSV